MIISVLEEVKCLFSGESVWRLYAVYEVVQFARNLCLKVVKDSSVPSQYDVFGWLDLCVDDVEFDPFKRCSLLVDFHDYRRICGGDEEFGQKLDSIENLFVGLAMGLLELAPVKELLNVAFSILCPPVLCNADRMWLRGEAEYFTDLLLSRGRITLAEQSTMISGFEQLVDDFRAKHSDGKAIRPCDLVAELFAVSAGNAGGETFLEFMLSLCGGYSGRQSGCRINLPNIEADLAVSTMETVSSWCRVAKVDNYGVVPAGMVESVRNVLSRVGNVYDELEDSMWTEVGRVVTAEYRRQLVGRLGFAMSGDFLNSPVMVRRSARVEEE